MSMLESSIDKIGNKLTHAGRLKARPLCVYASEIVVCASRY